MPWRIADFRGTRVYAHCDDSGAWKATDGRVEIRYKKGATKAYFAGASNLVAGDSTLLPDAEFARAAGEEDATAKSRPTKSTSTGASKKGPVVAPTSAREGVIVSYADGACTGNPGPCGLGVVVLEGDARHELSDYLGEGTNNIAELTAILRVAERYPGDPRAIEIYTDSSYAIGVLTKGWKAKANVELIAKIKVALKKLTKLSLHYVPGHAGVELNERADELARQAVKSRGSTKWT